MSKLMLVDEPSQVAQLSPRDREDLRLLRKIFNEGLKRPFRDGCPNMEEHQKS